MHIIFKSILFVFILVLPGCVTPSTVQDTPTTVTEHYINPGKNIEEYLSQGSVVFCDSASRLCAINVCMANDVQSLPAIIFKRYYPASKVTLIVSQVNCTQASLESSQIF